MSARASSGGERRLLTSQIRVAIGEVQSAILQDILVQITQLRPDMQFVGKVEKSNRKEEVARLKADVLICDVGPLELPEVCRELFGEEHPPVVVGLAREGREAAICIADAGVSQLTSIIRSAFFSAGRGDNVVKLMRHPYESEKDETVQPYSSNWECIQDQLRVLDLALLAEVEAFESTIVDEGVQRLQGLAISPDEVRALLQTGRTRGPRSGGEELRQQRHRMLNRVQQKIAASIGRSDAPPLAQLTEKFGLGPFEQFCLTAALAVEINRNTYGKAYAFLQDDVTRRRPSLDLLLRLFNHPDEDGGWQEARSFDASRPLRRWNLLRLPSREEGEPSTPLGRSVQLDERIARFLLGLDDLGSPLEEVTETGAWEASDTHVPAPPEAVERLARLVGGVKRESSAVPLRLAVHVHGRYGTGKRSLVASVCEQRNLRLLRVDAARLVGLPSATFEESLRLLTRESSLQPTALCLENIDSLLDDDTTTPQGLRAIARGLKTFSPVTFFVGERPWSPDEMFRDGEFQSVALRLPDSNRARQIWMEALSKEILNQDVDPQQLASPLAARFSLSQGQIHDAVAAAHRQVLWKTGHAALSLSDLYLGCREQCSHQLAKLATPVKTRFGWNDLILPEKQFSQLKELETAIRNASGVLEDWNFQSRLPYGRGITALFTGPSGTGKTMAAGILARELGLDLYKIDLSRVVSKYLGETEKNLDRIFRQAESSGAMLFFDEADALFGKRSVIKDAHDRYANIEIAYLLQKMEERLGATILATNLKTNMDDAFVRRIRFGIEFPMPEYPQRLQIWHGSLPEGAPLADDVDLSILAKRLRVSGGAIMNVCLGAASVAYQPRGVIAMKHFLHAAKRELQKIGQQYDERDFTPQENATVPAA